MNNKFINNNGVNLLHTSKNKKTKVEIRSIVIDQSQIELLKQQEQAIIAELSSWEDEIINCKLCQREIIIYSANKYPNVCFYDDLTDYNFCSYRCFNRRAETYQEWIETGEEDTD